MRQGWVFSDFVPFSKEEYLQLAGLCPKVDECYKLRMVLDKDFPEELYAVLKKMREVCEKCDGRGIDK
jgi:hypothetical protein